MQDVRSRLESAVAERRDPSQALKHAKVVIDSQHATVDQVRTIAPGLGAIWDTLRSVLAAVEHAAGLGSGGGEGVDIEGVHTAVPASQ